MKKKILCTVLGLTLILGMGITSMAAPVAVEGGGVFDAEYYAQNNADVVAEAGTDFFALWQHFTLFGANEGRLPFAPDTDWEYVQANGPFQSLTNSQTASTDTTTATTTTEAVATEDTTTTTPVEEIPATTEGTTTSTAANIDDLIGSYNGVPFSATGTSFKNTFGKDGWGTLNPDIPDWMQGNEGCYYYINNKYPNVKLVVQMVSDDTFIGYSIDALEAAKAGSTAYPNMTWKGLKLGSSEDDMWSTYGETSEGGEADGYYWYYYQLSDNMELDFEISPYSNGICTVELVTW
jgi:hypothetical protein